MGSRKTNGKRSAEEIKWGKYLRQMKALPFVDKGNRVSWWGASKAKQFIRPGPDALLAR
jgi:hypothetical protein